MDILKSKDIGLISAFVDLLLSSACKVNASDIHIDPDSESVRIRFRILGELSLQKRIDISIKNELIGRIKILSRLRTDQQERGQDGRFEFIYQKEKVDIRVSIVPTFYGESSVLRILRPTQQRDMSFESLGFDQEQIKSVTEVLNLCKGIILISGPTGSGKTTTAYAFVRFLLESGKNIVTIEDPIEYVIAGVRQVQIQDKGFSFVEGLRSVLRQDPDVIVIGEIRDSETAELAFRAALTGHLVVATIHAGSVTSISDRLLDLGVSKNSLSLVSLSIGQHLATIKTPEHRRVAKYEILTSYAKKN